MNDKPIKKIPKSEVKPPHRLYLTFANVRSSALEIARAIRDELGEKTPQDVKKFLETQGKAV